MKPIRSKNIKTFNDNDVIYVSRSLINTTVAKILSSNNAASDNSMLIEIMSDAVEQEYETKKIIPYIKMSVKDVKNCFPEYENLPRGSFFK